MCVHVCVCVRVYFMMYCAYMCVHVCVCVWCVWCVCVHMSLCVWMWYMWMYDVCVCVCGVYDVYVCGVYDVCVHMCVYVVHVCVWMWYVCVYMCVWCVYISVCYVVFMCGHSCHEVPVEETREVHSFFPSLWAMVLNSARISRTVLFLALQSHSPYFSYSLYLFLFYVYECLPRCMHCIMWVTEDIDICESTEPRSSQEQ